MEIVIALVVLAVLGVMAFGVFGSITLGAMGSAEQKRVEAAPSRFIGAGDTVIVTAGGREREATVKAADAAGYRLESSVAGRYDSTMVFKRREGWVKPQPTRRPGASPVDRFLKS